MGALKTPISARYTHACGHQTVPAGTNRSAAMMASQIKVLTTRFKTIAGTLCVPGGTKGSRLRLRGAVQDPFRRKRRGREIDGGGICNDKMLRRLRRF